MLARSLTHTHASASPSSLLQDEEERRGVVARVCGGRHVLVSRERWLVGFIVDLVLHVGTCLSPAIGAVVTIERSLPSRTRTIVRTTLVFLLVVNQ